MLVAMQCANICRVDEKRAKCLKISENALRIQIFFVYLPDFSRVTLACVYNPEPFKVGVEIEDEERNVLRNRDLECIKHNITNF